MNKILVIHLKRFGDLVSAGQLIASYRNAHPHAEVSLLCFEEFASITKLIPGLKSVYTLNRSTLLTLKSGKLYNNAFAIEELRSALSPVAEQSFDKIINLTNDKVSTYICSWLASQNNQCKIVGMYAQNNGLMRASNSWGIVFNDIATRTNNSPFNFRDIWAQMVGIEDSGATSMLTNSRNENNVKQHFLNLRQQGGHIIGIQATCSVADKGLRRETVIDCATKLYNNGDHPLLLIAPNDAEREYAKEILEALDFKPMIVESDFTALSSVVKNLDFLITPDTVTKHFADAQNVPCIEVSLGTSPVFKQATMLEKSRLIVAQDRHNRDVAADDILNVLYATQTNSPTLTMSSNVVVYRPVKIAGCISYQAIAGNINHAQEFDRHASSALILRSLNNNALCENEFAELSFKAPKALNHFNHWATQAKDESTFIMRDLLHAIRALLSMKESPRRANDFIVSLEKLFTHTEGVSVASIGVHFFRSRLESLPSANFSENARAIESLLFELKSDLQNCLNLINEWEKVWTGAKFAGRKERHTTMSSPQ